MRQKTEALARAIKIVGTGYKLAGILKISPQAISQWDRVPVEHVLKIEKATDGEVTRHELRPDIYPPDIYPKD